MGKRNPNAYDYSKVKVVDASEAPAAPDSVLARVRELKPGKAIFFPRAIYGVTLDKVVSAFYQSMYQEYGKGCVRQQRDNDRDGVWMIRK